jgi:hypothetical protein
MNGIEQSTDSLRVGRGGAQQGRVRSGASGGFAKPRRDAGDGAADFVSNRPKGLGIGRAQADSFVTEAERDDECGCEHADGDKAGQPTCERTEEGAHSTRRIQAGWDRGKIGA